MQLDLNQIYSSFQVEETFISGAPYGSGHIHDTFRIITEGKFNYILQRLNTHIFKDIDSLQENIQRVTAHLVTKLNEKPNSDSTRECLTLIPTKDDKPYFIDKDGKYWRCYIFISDHRSYDQVETPEQAYQGGRAFGKFQCLLADIPGKPLNETIPDFHNIESRLEAFYKVVEKDSVGRVAQAKEQIDFVKARAEKMQVILNLGREGKIPTRITHNDTKFNNVLLDQQDQALCVIDLDTIMPGHVHYDFGDAIRTGASAAAEDEEDLSKVKIDMDLYTAYAKGYYEEAKTFLTPIEVEHLPFAPQLLAFTIGLRFLTDYIDGDNYFKIKHKEHNLQRTKTQNKLLTSMEERYDDMKTVFDELSK